MSLITDSIVVMLSLLYIIAPYAMIIYWHRLRIPAQQQAPSVTAAFTLSLAAFCILAPPIMFVSFRAYSIFHSILTLALTPLIIFTISRREQKPHFISPGWGLPVLIAGAWLVRILPMLSGAPIVGGDARFHHVLARKLLQEGRLAADWLPFAEVPVVYPQGTHSLIAFISRVSHLAPHDVFTVLIPLLGALTVAAIVVLTDQVTRKRRAALTAGALYAFLPVWGSLGYISWGGIPNMLGMLFLTCAFGLLASPDSSKRSTALAIAILVAGITNVHHYSALVAALALGSYWLTLGDRREQMRLAMAGISGAVLALPALSFSYFVNASELGHSSVLVFNEAPITILEVIGYLHPLLVGAAILTLLRHREAGWTSRHNMILCWASSMLVAFVFLEYVYRMAVFALTGGEAFYTALTPSRMATNMVYPLSVLAGGVACLTSLARYRKLAIAVAFIAAIASTYSIMNRDTLIPFEAEQHAATWIAGHTDADALVYCDLPVSENWSYLCWRRNNSLILPASEAREHPRVREFRNARSLKDWIGLSQKESRALYYVTHPRPGRPPPYSVIYDQQNILIMKVAP